VQVSDLQRALCSPVEHCSALYSTGQGIILALPLAYRAMPGLQTMQCQPDQSTCQDIVYHAMPCRAMSCHVTPCFVMLCHCLPCQGMVYHGMPCQAKPWLYMAWHVMLYIAMYQLLPRVISMVSPSPTTSTSMLYPAMRQSRAWHAMLCHGLPCYVMAFHATPSHVP